MFPAGNAITAGHDFPYYCCEKTTDYGNNLSANYILPGSFLVKVPEDLPTEVAVLTEIFAVSVGLDHEKQIMDCAR